MKWFIEFTFQSPIVFLGMIILIAITLEGIAGIFKNLRK